MRALLIAFSVLSAPAQTSQTASVSVDGAAARVLDEMVKAYRSASRLRQETVYAAAEGKKPPLIRSRLAFSRPNRRAAPWRD